MNKKDKYFYVPFMSGTRYKCGGICTPDNRVWYLKEHPGTVVLSGYRGDQLTAAQIGKHAIKSNPTSRKKPRTAAQKAATRKLVAMMKAKRAGRKVTRIVKRKHVTHHNPRTVVRKVRKLRNTGLKYKVQCKRGTAWHTLASFASLELAKEYGAALSRKLKSKQLRVFW